MTILTNLIADFIFVVIVVVIVVLVIKYAVQIGNFIDWVIERWK